MQEAKELKNKIDTFLDNGRYVDAFDELEYQFTEFSEKEKDDLYLLAEIAGSYINLGSESFKKEAVTKGLKLFNDNKEVFKGFIREDSIDYCIGNGYHALYKISILNNSEFFPRPDAIREYLFDAKQAYLKSFKKLDLKNLNEYSIQVLTNLGNNLNQSGRIVEALQLFDTVLNFNPNFPQALVSKADGLLYMIRAANTEVTIALFLEIYTLFKKAHKSSVRLNVIRKTIEAGLQKSKEFLQKNNFDFTRINEEEELNNIEYQKHSKEIKYYLDNFLSLSEHGLYCKCNGAKIDNLVIGYPGLITNDRKIIHLEMLHNRIKSEFSLSRSLYYAYLFQGNSDSVHYEDLSFEIQNGIKYEKLRTSFRLCFGILDKIAEGLCYLFDLDAGEKENIYFESFWKHYDKKSVRWKKINSFNNIHLTALFSIACDLNKKNGEFGFYKLWRNKIEHGVFSITKSSDSKLKLISEKQFSSHTSIEDFELKTKHLLQLTRSAIFSYVFCAREELIMKNEKARR